MDLRERQVVCAQHAMMLVENKAVGLAALGAVGIFVLIATGPPLGT